MLRLARVGAQVTDQVFLARESLAAELTAVRRLAGVYPDVIRQVLLPREELGAVAALVWRFPCQTAVMSGTS